METLRVLVDAAPELRPEAARAVGEAAGLEHIDLGVDALAVELSEQLQRVIALLEMTPQSSHHYRVKDVSFSLAIGPDGHVSLLSPVAGAAEEQTGFTFRLGRTGTAGEEITPNLPGF